MQIEKMEGIKMNLEKDNDGVNIIFEDGEQSPQRVPGHLITTKNSDGWGNYRRTSEEHETLSSSKHLFLLKEEKGQQRNTKLMGFESLNGVNRLYRLVNCSSSQNRHNPAMDEEEKEVTILNTECEKENQNPAIDDKKTKITSNTKTKVTKKVRWGACTAYLQGKCDNDCTGPHPKVCPDFLKEKCSKGSNCELYHPPPCKFYLRNSKCKNESACLFLHPTVCQKYLQGKCKSNVECGLFHSGTCSLYSFGRGTCKFPNCQYLHPPPLSPDVLETRKRQKNTKSLTLASPSMLMNGLKGIDLACYLLENVSPHITN